MKSIRQQLTIRLLCALVIMMLVTGVGLYESVRIIMSRQFDAGLTAKVREIASLTKLVPTGLDFEFDDEFMAEFLPGHNAEYFEIWSDDGTVVAQSKSLKGRHLPRPELSDGQSPKIWNIELPNRRSGRAVALRFLPTVDHEWEEQVQALQQSGTLPPAFRSEVTIAVARSRSGLDGPLALVLGGILVAGVLMLGGVLIVTTRVVQRGLGPLEHFSQSVARIDDASLSMRLNEESIALELKPIQDRLNELLGRLESAFQREQRFSTNAAHELRTPVAELRSLAEVALKWPESLEAQAEAMSQVVEIAGEMERIVTVMLSLARTQHGEIPLDLQEVRLRPLVDDVWSTHKAAAERKHLRYEYECAPALAVCTDASLLRLILTNLLENAVEYSPVGGRIQVQAADVDSTVRLTVINTTDSLTADDLTRLSEPFWRKGHKSAKQSHAGLGLTLVHSLCAALGVQVSESIERGSELQVQLTFNGRLMAGASYPTRGTGEAQTDILTPSAGG